MSWGFIFTLASTLSKGLKSSWKPILLNLLIFFGIWFGLRVFNKAYQNGYEEGVKITTSTFKEELNQLTQKAREKELRLEKQLSQVRKEAYAQQQEAETSIANANNAISRLQSQIRKQTNTRKSNACITTSTRGTDVSSSKCGFVLEEALRRYQEVAADADRLVERLRVSQGWGNVVLESQVQE